MNRKSTYSNHKFNNSQELDDILRREYTRDRSYMLTVLKANKQLLDSYNIIEYIDFVDIFYKFNLNNEKIRQFLIGFTRYYNSSLNINNDQKILWLKNRICKQSNSCEKNVFFAVLSHEHKSKLLEYLSIYLSQEINELEKYNHFYDEFTNKIKLVENQVQKIENNIKETEMKDYYIDDYFEDEYIDDQIQDPFLYFQY